VAFVVTQVRIAAVADQARPEHEEHFRRIVLRLLEEDAELLAQLLFVFKEC
jgi:ferritin-like protein